MFIAICNACSGSVPYWSRSRFTDKALQGAAEQHKNMTHLVCTRKTRKQWYEQNMTIMAKFSGSSLTRGYKNEAPHAIQLYSQNGAHQHIYTKTSNATPILLISKWTGYKICRQEWGNGGIGHLERRKQIKACSESPLQVHHSGRSVYDLSLTLTFTLQRYTKLLVLYWETVPISEMLVSHTP